MKGYHLNMRISIKLENTNEDILKNMAEWFVKSRKMLPAFICLNGEVGVGKTTFARYVANYVDSSINFSSPTYSIVNIYNTNIVSMYHFDLYRITLDDYEWILEYFEEQQALFLIEWSNLHPELLEDLQIFEILIEYVEDSEKRNITITFDDVYRDTVGGWINSEGFVFEECNITTDHIIS